MQNNSDAIVVEAKNAINGETIYILKSKLNEFNHRIEKDGTIIFIPETRNNNSCNESGCAVFLFLFVLSIATACGVVMYKEYKANKKHPNVISGIYDKDKKIIISDVNTHVERMIEYAGYKDKFAEQNQLPEFEEQIKQSNIGDTVIFVSPNYEKREKFVLDSRNRLYLNKDSIIMRTKKTRQR